MGSYRAISVDNHLDLKWMPTDLWQQRVPARFRDRAPKVVDTGESKADHHDKVGTLVWEWEGQKRGPSAADEDNSFALETFTEAGVETPVGSLPPSDPKVLIGHMDAAGIWAHMIYGPTRKMLFDDPELDAVCNRAYNDYMIEMSNAAPGRIVGLPNMPTKFPEQCVAEAQRMAEAGAKGVEFSIFTAAEPVWSPVWEPLWSVLEETGLVLGFHIGAKAGEPYPPNEHGRYPAHFCSSPFSTQTAMAQIVFSGALDRHPELKVVFAECRTGWLPFFIEHMDRQARERPTDVPLSMLPSEFWKRQMAASFEDDLAGGQLLREDWSHLQYGVMWGADYPHNPVSWPDTEKVFSWMLDGVDPDVSYDARIGRAASFYQLDLPDDIA